MISLNLPEYSFNIRNSEKKSQIFDHLRKKFVSLTPEEWVRQNIIRFLIEEKKYPAGLIAIEKSLQYNGMDRRTDAVVFNKEQMPILIVECKSYNVKISQKTFDQIARYNMTLKVKFLLVTNGLEHYCCEIDFLNQTYIFIQEIPMFEDLLKK